MSEVFSIAGIDVDLGQRKRIDLDVAQLFDFTPMTITLEVIRGKEDGPTLFITAAIHGDEINGTEIARRLLKHKCLKKLKGTLIVAPIVNVFGFNSKSRYLPDRRDLNRCFPGSEAGSLGAQLANIVVKEIIAKSTHGIDLHTGSQYRTNFPQIRADLDNPETERMARAFNMPIMLNANLRQGSLRETAMQKNIPVITFEGGEALRYDEHAIRLGLHGVLNVMDELGMIKEKSIINRRCKDVCMSAGVAKSSSWLRSPSSGIFIARKKLGDKVKKDEIIAVISDPLAKEEVRVRALRSGIIIGKYELPLVNSGDAMFHIAYFDDIQEVQDKVQLFEDLLDSEI